MQRGGGLPQLIIDQFLHKSNIGTRISFLAQIWFLKYFYSRWCEPAQANDVF